MAFGFFKKSETADILFKGGQIYTQNTDWPWVEAVACKDGLVYAVGDYEDLAELEGKHTEIVDLEGGYMLPGYIDTCGHPAMNAFRDSCLFLDAGDLEETIAQISAYASENEAADILFAYGFNEEIMKDLEPERARALLDSISMEKPVVAFGRSGFHCFVNTAAMEIVRAAAEEDQLTGVSLNYILGVLDPLDLDTLPAAIPAMQLKYSERGFTSVFDCGAPEYFSSVFQNMMIHLYQEELLRQRFYGSLLVACNVNPKAVMQKIAQFRTNCAELNGLINFTTLKLIMAGEGESSPLSGDVLRELCMDAGDRGFDIHIDAVGEAAAYDAVDALSAPRSAGYKKNAFVLALDPVSDSQELADACAQYDIVQTGLTLNSWDDPWACIKNAKTPEEAVDILTIDAAIQLGISDRYGSIEKGRHADFTIFDENPLEMKSLDEFKRLRSVMTIVNGAVVYDREEV